MLNHVIQTNRARATPEATIKENICPANASNDSFLFPTNTHTHTHIHLPSRIHYFSERTS